IVGDVQDIRDGLVELSKSFEEGRFFREGLRVAIVGRPNVGKSSLMNALLKQDRAIVTDTAGTTRDVIEEYLNIQGLPVRIMDTAGIREAHEMAEKEGVLRSLRAIENADIVIAVLDGSIPMNNEDRIVLEKLMDKKSIITINKSDLPLAQPYLEIALRTYSINIVKLSAKTGSGLDPLKDKILSLSVTRSGHARLGSPFDEDLGVIVTNVRHRFAIDGSVTALNNGTSALRSGMPFEIVAVEMRDALDKLGEIVGAVTTEDILNRIFSDFCIGK
ncbi:MAG TPA: GTPase, partial [Thermodesulfovibrionales bacterium]|nr:GTPase [Thermodesulfovibrionales bacterium]